MALAAASYRRRSSAASVWLLLPLLAVLSVDALISPPILVGTANVQAVSATVHQNSVDTGIGVAEAAKSRRYLIASFPNMKQVAYCQLPDNVWRPLVLGSVASPKGVVVDPTNARLFVSDPPSATIWLYNLVVRPDGKLMTTGEQFVAVEGYVAQWMSVDAVGDLYFSGKKANDTDDSIYRHDASKILNGQTLAPFQVYSRSNSGSPTPKAWSPSGIAVDSFSVYWGNQDGGLEHGGVVRGPRQNIARLPGSGGATAVTAMSSANDKVLGMAITTYNLYYLTPQGVYGLPKDEVVDITDPTVGLVAPPPTQPQNGQKAMGDGGEAFSPRGLAYDGDNTMYFSENKQGIVYAVPAADLNRHDLVKFVDAPGVFGVAVANFERMSSGSGFQPAGISASPDGTVRTSPRCGWLMGIALAALCAAALRAPADSPAG